jgi:hypothetical protein
MSKLTHTITLDDYSGLNKTEEAILMETLEDHLGFKPTESDFRKCSIVQWANPPGQTGPDFYLRRYTFMYEQTNLGQMDVSRQSHSIRCQFFYPKK